MREREKREEKRAKGEGRIQEGRTLTTSIGPHLHHNMEG